MAFSIDTYFLDEYSNNRVCFVVSNIVEQQVGYILLVLVLPYEISSTGSSPTWIEYPPIPQKASALSFWTLCHNQYYILRSISIPPQTYSIAQYRYLFVGVDRHARVHLFHWAIGTCNPIGFSKGYRLILSQADSIEQYSTRQMLKTR